MIKRPIHHRFSDAVLEGRKITTMREKPWPVGPPIILYHWTGAPYRSEHSDVAVIEVTGTVPIVITHEPDGEMIYEIGRSDLFPLPPPHLLWNAEGFDSREEMAAWFRKVVKPGRTMTRHLMRFRLIKKLSHH